MSRGKGELPRFEVNESDEKRWRQWMGKGNNGPTVDAVVRIQREIDKLKDKRDMLAQRLDEKAEEFADGSNWAWSRPSFISDSNEEKWYEVAAEMPVNSFWRRVYARMAAHCERMKP